MPSYIAILDAEVAAEQPVTVSLMTRLRDNILSYAGAPAGTKAAWQQTAAPLGWTKDTTHHDKVPRIISTGTAGSGGSVAFSTVFARTATDLLTLATTQIPSHAHGGITGNDNVHHTHVVNDHTHAGGGLFDAESHTANRGDSIAGADTVTAVNATGGESTGGVNGGAFNTGGVDNNHQHSVAAEGGGQGHQHGIDLRCQYVDFIIAEKAA